MCKCQSDIKFGYNHHQSFIMMNFTWADVIIVISFRRKSTSVSRLVVFMTFTLISPFMWFLTVITFLQKLQYCYGGGGYLISELDCTGGKLVADI